MWMAGRCAALAGALALSGCESASSGDASGGEGPKKACSPAVPASKDALDACSADSVSPYAKPKPTPHTDLPPSALGPNALTSSAAAMRTLTTSKLSSDLFDPETGPVASLARDEGARALLQGIIACACDPGVEIGQPLPSAVVGEGLHAPPWSGELGLCGPKSPAGDWGAAPPTESCLELVSACVLARVDAAGLRAPVSLRGGPECLFPLRDAVPVETRYREDRGREPIASFEPCQGDVDPGDPCRRCGFSPRHVGRCVAGAKVTLKAVAGTLIRVCKGIHGCDEADPGLPYTGTLDSDPPGACGASAPEAITFVCPENGPGRDEGSLAARRWGYYSVMFASATSVDPATLLSIEDAVGTDCQSPFADPDFLACNTYPAPEADVFTYREGAYYGTAFGGVAHETGCSPPQPGLLGAQQHACFGEPWTDGTAHLRDRLCEKPDDGCLANTPLPCASDTSVHACDGASLDGAYRECDGSSASPAWPLPLTVYLNHPCDLTRAPGPACALGESGLLPPR